MTHRGTGIALTGLISGGSIGLVASGMDISSGLSALAALPAPVILFGKFALAWPVTYHTLNGVRHLVWDSALGLDSIGGLEKSGWATLAAATLAAAGLAAL